MASRQLIRARKICLALPETTEKKAWGAPTFRIRDRLFAIFADNHHGDGRVALWCHAPPGEQEHVVDADPDRFFVPPYVGPRGWIGLLLNRLGDDEVTTFARQAYWMVAPKKLRAQIEEEED